MTDIRTTIVPKSDQLNADDLIGTSKTIKVTKVDLCAGDQPVSIHYENENGRPYKPCKSMRRVLVHVWGPDGNAYIGRSMTLYCDEKVQFGGQAVGGIRISHMSHIDKDVVIALTATRAKRVPFIVKPLVTPRPTPQTSTATHGATDEPQGWRTDLWTRVQAAGITQEQFGAEFGSLKALLYSRLSDVEAWIKRTTAGESAGDTCPECGGPLDGTDCHNESCPLGVPPE